jgi:hypothetical protein
MARIIGYLNPALRRQYGAKGPATRILAVTSIVTLLVASLAPAWAVAAEPDTEGEGTSPPGLENPHFEPGGEEAALETLPGAIESGSIPETVEGPPIETEPAQEPELPEPAPSAEAAPPVEPEPAPLPPPTEAPAPATPEYTPAGPEYVAPAASAAPVENEPIVAPPSASKSPPKAEPPPQPEPAAVAPEAVAEVSPPATPSSKQQAPLPAPPPATVAGSGGVSAPLVGRSSYTVRPGDCLWSVAEAVLPSGAGNDEIAAEVARLWRMNAGRIGSGDPNVILIGTELRLH